MATYRTIQIGRGSAILVLALVMGILSFMNPIKPPPFPRGLLTIQGLAFWTFVPLGVMGVVMLVKGLRLKRE